MRTVENSTEDRWGQSFDERQILYISKPPILQRLLIVQRPLRSEHAMKEIFLHLEGSLQMKLHSCQDLMNRNLRAKIKSELTVDGIDSTLCRAFGTHTNASPFLSVTSGIIRKGKDRPHVSR